MNGVAWLAGTGDARSKDQREDQAASLLALLHRIEAGAGRERPYPNASRTLDLDLLAFGRLVRAGPGGPVLPHPRMHLRRFVLAPLVEILPGWRHPLLGQTAADLLAALPPGPPVQPISA